MSGPRRTRTWRSLLLTTARQTNAVGLRSSGGNRQSAAVDLAKERRGRVRRELTRALETSKKIISFAQMNLPAPTAFYTIAVLRRQASLHSESLLRYGLQKSSSKTVAISGQSIRIRSPLPPKILGGTVHQHPQPCRGPENLSSSRLRPSRRVALVTQREVVMIGRR